MLPAGVLPGLDCSDRLSMKNKLFGGAAQINGVLAPGVLLIRVMFRLKRVPAPLAVSRRCEKAEMRNVRVDPWSGIQNVARVRSNCWQ